MVAPGRARPDLPAARRAVGRGSRFSPQPSSCRSSLLDADELGALGAAIIAAVGVGLYPDLETAVAAMTSVRDRIEPDPALVDILARRGAAFKALRNALSPLWATL